MSGTVPWIAAQTDTFDGDVRNLDSLAAWRREKRLLASKASAPEFSRPTATTRGLSASGLPKHQFPALRRPDAAGVVPEYGISARKGEAIPLDKVQAGGDGQEEARLESLRQQEQDRESELRQYRGRTQNMLRRYMRYSLEAGRLPSILGSEFFRTRVTSYSVVTFEDRVIFVHDMEICLEKVSELSRQILARYVLQGHGLRETAKLVHCTLRTTRRNVPIALDELSEILLKMGLMEELDSNRQKSCQGDKNDECLASDSEQGK